MNATSYRDSVPFVHGYEAFDGHRVRVMHPMAAPIVFPADDGAHAERLASALRGMLAHAYHAGRADAEQDAAR